MMANPRLPPELTDIIIGLLSAQGDAATLAACALVCRSWIPASRHNIFAQLTITPENISGAADFLASATSTIAPVVTDLVLHDVHDCSSLHSITDRLPNVTQLTIRAENQFLRLIWLSSFAPLLPRLENLHLINLRFDQHDTLLSLLRRCIRLQSLSCKDVRIGYITRASPSPLSLLMDRDPLTPKLKKLTVSANPDFFPSPTPELLYCVMELWRNGVPRLAELRMDWDTFALSEASARILRAVGSSLHVLGVFGFSNHSTLVRCAPRFAFLTQLRSLILQLSSHLSPINPNEHWRSMFSALRHLRSPRLQDLTIMLRADVCDQPDPDAWSGLESLLETTQSPFTLHTLTFWFLEDLVSASTATIKLRERWIAERFPLCAARGILRVHSRKGVPESMF